MLPLVCEGQMIPWKGLFLYHVNSRDQTRDQECWEDLY